MFFAGRTAEVFRKFNGLMVRVSPFEGLHQVIPTAMTRGGVDSTKRAKDRRFSIRRHGKSFFDPFLMLVGIVMTMAHVHVSKKVHSVFEFLGDMFAKIITLHDSHNPLTKGGRIEGSLSASLLSLTFSMNVISTTLEGHMVYDSFRRTQQPPPFSQELPLFISEAYLTSFADPRHTRDSVLQSGKGGFIPPLTSLREFNDEGDIFFVGFLRNFTAPFVLLARTGTFFRKVLSLFLSFHIEMLHGRKRSTLW